MTGVVPDGVLDQKLIILRAPALGAMRDPNAGPGAIAAEAAAEAAANIKVETDERVGRDTLRAIINDPTVLGFAHSPSVNSLVDVAPAMAYVVAVATVAAGLAYNKGVRQLGISHGIVFINFVPVSALLIGVLRGSMPRPMEVIGTVLVVSALLLQAKLMQRQAAAAAK